MAPVFESKSAAKARKRKEREDKWDAARAVENAADDELRALLKEAMQGPDYLVPVLFAIAKKLDMTAEDFI